MTGFNADPEKLDAAAAKLREAIDYTESASQYSEEADPDWWMWGLPGLMFAGPYFLAAEGWRTLMEEVGQGIEGLAGRLDGTSGNYTDIDSIVGEKFAGLLVEAEGSVDKFTSSNQKKDPYGPGSDY
ncbi:hypothetical protein [Salininema proteolyticum]|uniref:Excreted virulence factor EspC, type VII ESX diderm n=1 Tax=Salininema proteolyticum TaxID=1607685 RepID=A0ABV8U208_9ACTN